MRVGHLCERNACLRTEAASVSFGSTKGQLVETYNGLKGQTAIEVRGEDWSPSLFRVGSETQREKCCEGSGVGKSAPDLTWAAPEHPSPPKRNVPAFLPRRAIVSIDRCRRHSRPGDRKAGLRSAQSFYNGLSTQPPGTVHETRRKRSLESYPFVFH
jgi:hypothetical protein